MAHATSGSLLPNLGSAPMNASIEKPDSLGAKTMATHTFNYSVPHSLRVVTHIFIFISIYLDATNDEVPIPPLPVADCQPSSNSSSFSFSFSSSFSSPFRSYFHQALTSALPKVIHHRLWLNWRPWIQFPLAKKFLR